MLEWIGWWDLGWFNPIHVWNYCCQTSPNGKNDQVKHERDRDEEMDKDICGAVNVYAGERERVVMMDHVTCLRLLSFETVMSLKI